MHAVRLNTLLLVVLVGGCGGGGGETVVDPPPLPPVDTVATNRAPVISIFPDRSADHNRLYEQRFSVSDADGDEVSVGVQAPAWLSFDPAVNLISGLAGEESIGTHEVTVRATDGVVTTESKYTIVVQFGEIVCNEGWVSPAESPFVLPYPVGKTQSIIQSYCTQFSHNNWFAYDIDTQIGDTLIASRSGVVIFLQESFVDNTQVNGEQNFVFIEHVDGTVMWYVHLTNNGVLVEVGDSVVQGQPIAISGNSGATAGPHVHLVLSRDRTNFDREVSLPVSYRNAGGTFDPNGGLALGQSYEALPFTPDNN